MQIKTYKGKHIYQPHFFILNKGNNCGKPLSAACANCFVCLLNTAEEKEFYYWLCFALWQTSQFSPYLSGSLIPFIHIKSVKDVIGNAICKIKDKPEEYQKNLAILIDINNRQKIIEVQLKILSQAKKAILNNVLK